MTGPVSLVKPSLVKQVGLVFASLDAILGSN